MKRLFVIFLLIALLQAQIPLRILQSLRILAPECNYHGHLYKGKCYCESQWKGTKCEIKKGHGIHDTDDECDDLVAKMDDLNNISENDYDIDDDEFPRLSGDSVGSGDAAYGAKGNQWIKMHDLSDKFQIYSNQIGPTDIHQGALGDCYLLAAFAGLVNVDKGSYIKNLFESNVDNSKHIYVSRWFYGGKVRFVAVDDWVPGIDGAPSFQQVAKENDFWPLILEKAWAKIHGTYMAAQYGWHTEVWKALLGAPTFEKWHEKSTGLELWTLIKNLISQGFAVGAATSSAPNTHEVASHAYAVLGAYEVTLDNGSKQKLILYHNPWSRDVWAENPWGDASPKWTAKVKAQLPMYNNSAEDGLTFVTPEDYVNNFGITNWVEIHKDYDVSWLDIAFHEGSEQYTVNFNLVSNGKDAYVFVDKPNTRQLLGCDPHFDAYDMVVTAPNGAKFTGDDKVKIPNAAAGKYTLTVQANSRKAWAKYFTVSAYAFQNSLGFEEPANNAISYNEKSCPKDCNDNGRCNTFKGVCTCYWSYSGDDCSVFENKTIPKPYCEDSETYTEKCIEWASWGECERNPGFMAGNCPLTCKKCTPDPNVPKPIKPSFPNPDYNCTDVYPKCYEWAKSGGCRADNAYFMKRHCRASCHTCDFQTPNPPKPYPPVDPQNCTDEDERCVNWAARGECDANPEWMPIHCPLSCNRCNEKKKTECVDDTSNCTLWAKNGECKQNPRFMWKACMASCKACDGNPDPNPEPTPDPEPEPEPEPEPTPDPNPNPPVPGCKDYNTDCDKNSCKDQANAKIYCAKTCNLCNPKCEDYDKNCESWANSEQCQQAAYYLLPNCRKSCKECTDDQPQPQPDPKPQPKPEPKPDPKPTPNPTPVTCQDYRTDCDSYKGTCDSDPKFMKVYCPKTCNVCDRPCEDLYDGCSGWTEGGMCDSNKEFMLPNCRKSCKQC